MTGRRKPETAAELVPELAQGEDLVNISDPYSEALPILMGHLRNGEYSDCGRSSDTAARAAVTSSAVSIRTRCSGARRERFRDDRAG